MSADTHTPYDYAPPYDVSAPAPRPTPEPSRLGVLEEAVTALTARVAALEAGREPEQPKRTGPSPSRVLTQRMVGYLQDHAGIWYTPTSLAKNMALDGIEIDSKRAADRLHTLAKNGGVEYEDGLYRYPPRDTFSLPSLAEVAGFFVGEAGEPE